MSERSAEDAKAVVRAASGTLLPGRRTKGADVRLTRGEMLKLSALGSAALLLPVGRNAYTGSGGDRLRRLPTPFEAEFRLPETLAPTRRTNDTDLYEMTMQRARVEIVPGLETEVWGYNGMFPGPTIRARERRKVVMRLTNRLPNPTSMHVHGVYADGDNDGHPSDLIPPGGQKTYTLPNDQTSRMMWYHDHAEHITALNVYMGLAGLYIGGDDFEDNLPLPADEFDVPLVLQDRLFFADGSFDYPVESDDGSSNGVFGDVILVNGAPWPRMEVANRKYRFRILNGSNARVYEPALSTGDPYTLVGNEGGLLERPLRLRSLPISGAERADIVVDFSRYPIGSKVVLKNLRRDRGRRRRDSRISEGGTAEIMRFDVVRRARDDSRVPDPIRAAADQEDPTHLPADPSEAERTRRFEFERHGGEWTINDKVWDVNRIDAAPREGDVEIWELVNGSGGWIHPIHLHLVNFKILDRDGRPPPPFERGWKETIFLSANESARVLIKWPKVPVGPEPGEFVRRYPFHCHLIEHEDHDMMLQFRVDEAPRA